LTKRFRIEAKGKHMMLMVFVREKVTTFGKKRGDRQSSAFVKLDIAPSVE
jgi:hypothetical protein